MQIDVGAYIAPLLYEYETVSIPGLGGFVSSYKGASIDQVQGKLLPPSKDLDFNKNLVVNDGLLINYIKEKHQLSASQAQQAVSEYIERVKEAVDRREIVVLPRVGRLYKDYEKNLQFLPDNTNFNTGSYGLPVVQFYPVMRNERSGSAAHKAAGSAQKTRAGDVISRNISAWFQKGLPLIAVMSVIVISLGAWFLFFDKPSEETGEKPIIPASRVNVSPATEEDDEEIVLSPGVDEEIVELSEEEALEDEQGIDTEGATVDPSQKFCIIAVGLFREESNVQKLVEKIYSEGFQPYVETNARGTKVGVQMPYDDEEELRAALETVREKFNHQAIIMKK